MPRTADKRLLIVLLVCVAITALFWTGSRYPALNEKALMGGTTILEDPLGFEAVLPVNRSDPLYQRVAYSTVNWIATNRQGMSFGLALAAAFLSLVRLLHHRKLQGRFSSSFAGMLLGAPLGVCVNCSAPIARGLLAGGARLETSLAAMISSPTLNVVVLAMLISLFPPYMVALKLGLSLFFMLVCLPLLTHFAFGAPEVSNTGIGRIGEASAQQNLDLPWVGEPESRWWPALRWVAVDYLRNLWFIVRRTVPLMLLAGLIGAATMSVLPWEVIAGTLPDRGVPAVLLATLGLAFLGLLLPVPIAFDVVVCAGLLGAGMPPGYVMVLLFSLGIFSVYSFSVVWEAVSLRVASWLAGTLLGLSVAAGGFAMLYEQIHDEQARQIIERFLRAEPRAAPQPSTAQPAHADPELNEKLLATRKTWQAWPGVAPDGLQIKQRKFAPRTQRDEPHFQRLHGPANGLTRMPHPPLAYKMMSPYYRNTPIAAGDVHGDGRPDLLFGTEYGLQLFANLDGTHFTQQRIDVPALDGRYAGNAALVDLNNDGWLDLFVSIHRGGNHIVFNHEGHFGSDGHMKLPETGANLAAAVAFGDLDRDGLLEIALGNWTGGEFTPRPPERSRNHILWQQRDGYASQALEFVPGETLSTLISDLDNDGRSELLFGNDFNIPDAFYRVDDRRHLRRLEKTDSRIPVTTHSTMSIDSADIDNDLRLDIYQSQITGSAPGQRERLSIVKLADTCTEYTEPAWVERCLMRAKQHGPLLRSRNERSPAACAALDDPSVRNDCIVLAMMRRGSRDRDPGLCNQIPASWESFAFTCRQAHEEPVSQPHLEATAIRQIRNRNALLMQRADGTFDNRAQELGVDVAGWGWTAKFADLDGDGWQDLYVVGGRVARKERVSNVFLRNLEGTRFADETLAYGLQNHLASSAYTYVDLDEDGDLDIVSIALDGPVMVYRNQSHANHFIAFDLEDELGNRQAIGSRVVVHYGPEAGLHQLRELKLGGGYVSFDPVTAHFGLGSHTQVESIEIRWSTGEQSYVTGPFATGHRYLITRLDNLNTPAINPM